MDKPEKPSKEVWSAFRMAGQLGYAIAIPIVILAFAGRLLDRQFGSSPLFLLAGVVLAIVVSSVWVVRKAKEIERDLTEKIK